MDIVYGILLVLHLVGWAIVLGGSLAGLRSVTLYQGTVHGILTALITGILMVGLASAGVAGGDPNNIKIGVKLVIALAVTGLVIYGSRNSEKVTKGYLAAIAGLTVVNVAIAVLWS
jgi:hypothetical protein